MESAQSFDLHEQKEMSNELELLRFFSWHLACSDSEEILKQVTLKILGVISWKKDRPIAVRLQNTVDLYQRLKSLDHYGQFTINYRRTEIIP
jgi:hypothetical protein